MAEELIDRYIDRAGIEQDTAFILEKLNEVYGSFQKLDNVKIRLGGANGLGDALPGIKEAKTNLDSLEAATQTVTQRIQQMNGQSKEFTQVLLTQTKATKEAAAASLSDAKAKTEEAKARYFNAKAANEEAKASDLSAKQAEKEEKAKKQLEKTQQALNAARIKEEEKLGKLNNAYEQLKAKYTIAANTAKQLAAAKGLDNEETKEAIAQAQKYYVSLLDIEKAVGQSQRNVGNYTQATFALTQVIREAPAFANSFATGISAISNNIPNLVDQFKILSTQLGSNTKALAVLGKSLFSFTALLPIGFLLIQTFGKEISNFFKNLFSGTSTMKAFVEQQRLLNKALEDSKYQEAVKNVKELTVYIDLAKKGFIDKKDVLTEYNKKLGDSIGKAKDLDEAERLIVKNGEAFIKTTLLKAAASAALAEAAQLAVDIAKEQFNRDPLEKADLRRSAFENATKEEINAYNELRKKADEAFFKGDKESFDKLSKQADEIFSAKVEAGASQSKKKQKAIYETIAANFLTQAAELSKQFNFDLFGNKDPKEKIEKLKDNIDEINKLLAETRKTEFENAKALLEDRIKDAKFIYENEDNSIKQRLEGLQLFYFASRQLANKQREFEITNLNITTQQELKAIEEKGKTDKLSQQKINAEKQALLQKSKAEEVAIERKFNSSILDARREVYKSETELYKQKSEKILEEEKLLQQQLEKLIEEGYKNFLKWLAKRKEANDKDADDRKRKEEEYERSKTELQKQLISELSNLSFTLLTASLERRKNQLQAEITLIDERKAKEIEAANQTFTNTQEKAAAIAVIEARANAQKEQLQRRQKELDIKKAQFDKAQAIARIVQETAQNVVKYIGSPLLLALAASIGAAQLAAVIAQPIPRYRTGKNQDDYEGPAIVGDGGKRELHIREDGSMVVTPDRPTLTYVRKKDIILPDAQAAVNAVVSGQSSRRALEPGSLKDDSVEKAINRMEKNVVQAISNHPKQVTTATDSGMAKLWKWGANQTKYINEQTNW